MPLNLVTFLAKKKLCSPENTNKSKIIVLRFPDKSESCNEHLQVLGSYWVPGAQGISTQPKPLTYCSNLFRSLKIIRVSQGPSWWNEGGYSSVHFFKALLRIEQNSERISTFKPYLFHTQHIQMDGKSARSGPNTVRRDTVGRPLSADPWYRNNIEQICRSHRDGG